MPSALRRLPLSNGRRGQTMVIAALMFVVLFGFAGLALDAGHVYLVYRLAQNASDAAGLAGGKKLSASLRSGPITSATDPAVVAARDQAASNGFFTNSTAACSGSTAGAPQPGLTQFSASWVDAGTCAGGYTTRVDVYSPPQTLTSNCTNLPYNCMQVVITRTVQNYLMGVLGLPTTTVSTTASVFAQPAGTVASLPPNVALYLYQPQSGCNALPRQCFDETKVPQRAQLSCLGVQNCPTFWVQPGSAPLIAGLNGTLTQAGVDVIGMQSNGDMVLQDATTLCDPFGGPCSPSTTTGSMGFALASGSKLYCSSPTTGLAPLPCTTTGPGGATLGAEYGGETSFVAPSSWFAKVDTTGLPNCGSLVLNGDQVGNSLGLLGACKPPASDPYTIQPGIYSWIVINHGLYNFEAGVYQMTGTAPQNTAVAGIQANGIDHTGEAAADWDLCPSGPCPATAGVWIGHGTSPFVTGAAGSGITCADGEIPLPNTGGGDVTQVTGNGVTFQFSGPASGGFVSTHEVNFISLDAPGLGVQPRNKGVPVLFDLENDSFIHLDASGLTNTSHFNGIIYQNWNARYGGVEVNPGLGGGKPATKGQVLAFSYTTFGTSGPAIDFSQGLGSVSGPPLSSTGGNQEPEILGIPAPALVAPSPPKAGFQTLVWYYTDEWKLDGYTVSAKVNNGSPVYFSQGIWNPTPAAGVPLPPPTGAGTGFTNPGDGAPAYPAVTQDPSNKYQHVSTSNPSSDWIMTYSNGSTFELNGAWIWGHEQDITGATEAGNQVTLKYTFPIPLGPQSTITIFMSDGDSCGDWVTVTMTLNNLGGASPGLQSAGTVHLEQ